MSDIKDEIDRLHKAGTVMQFYIGSSDFEIRSAVGMVEIETGEDMDIELSFIPARTIHSWVYQPGSVPRDARQPQWFHIFVLCSWAVEYRYSLLGQKEAFDFINRFKRAYAQALKQSSKC